jgi:histidine triad (HIT) family protein
MDPECLFCRIVAKQIPTDLILQTEDVTAFRDINPQAPVHVLIVPNQHVANTDELEPRHDAAVGALVRAARELAQREGVTESGYRLVINTGRDANNTVPHLHVHFLGGRRMSWPPG